MAPTSLVTTLAGVPDVRATAAILPPADEQVKVTDGDRDDGPGRSGIDGPGSPDTMVVGLFRGGILPPRTEEVLAAVGIAVETDLRTADFRAHVGEALVLATPTGPWQRVVVTGLGQVSELTPEVLRRAAGAAARAVATTAAHVATTLAQVDPSDLHARAVVEGVALGVHRDERFRSDPSPATVELLTLVVSEGRVGAVDALAPRARRHARAQLIARELVTTPAGHLGPVELADWVVAELGDVLDVEVFDEDWLAEHSCGGLLGVAAGSVRPPRLVKVTYRSEQAIASLALVGKGITFDSGGLSLKPPKGQEVMKKDMGGVATILGAMSALADSSLPITVTAWLALAENMPSGTATRPGDVLTMADGQTVTVANTDAEGRLVMADALALASADGVDAIIDAATLTGAVQHAVGRRAFGVFGNDDELLDRVLTAAAAAGELAWHLPLWSEVDPELDDEVGDIINVVWPSDKERGGATIAGLFLQRFVHDVPWVHLDISGAAWAEVARGHLPANATGTGVRTLLHLLEASEVD
ncbi:leucyl aminopeptidase [Salsipaludibacter albus]|uniref:leucyl aminopeptidase n=1 Tax=Salsipaludibacter albus TaxID=2849650 RepID=UPI001EE3D0D2|nr:leucyl aminopeptidase [Salsipaludibacter albus]MBY5162889.1 leucyl aminopeptidase [Salsipaludibacter albus]